MGQNQFWTIVGLGLAILGLNLTAFIFFTVQFQNVNARVTENGIQIAGLHKEIAGLYKEMADFQKAVTEDIAELYKLLADHRLEVGQELANLRVLHERLDMLEERITVLESGGP